MSERFVRIHMPPEEEQLNEVLQLRSQGMTYKQIAEKTGHPQSTVAHWCQSNTPKSPQNVEVLMVNDFEPGTTVITLPIHKFEFYRKSDLIYFTCPNHGSSVSELYEIRGTIIHKTTFPARGELYPYFTDIILEKGSMFESSYYGSLGHDRPRLAKHYAQTAKQNIGYFGSLLRKEHPQHGGYGSVLEQFEQWARDKVDSWTERIPDTTKYQILSWAPDQYEAERVEVAYAAWERHQHSPKPLTELSALGKVIRGGAFDALFEAFVQESKIPKKHAKIALEINSLDAKKIKHFVDSGASSLQEFEQLHASGLATFAEFERVAEIIPHIGVHSLRSYLVSFGGGRIDQHGVPLQNYKEIHDMIDDISRWSSIKNMVEALDVGFEVEEHKEYKRWIAKLRKTNWELTHARINQFRQLEWNLDDLLRFDSPEDMALHAIIETSPDMVSHAKLLENYKATHGTNLGNAHNLHDRLQSPPFDTMVESDLDAGIIQKLAGTKAKRKPAPKPKKTAKKDATPDVSKALVDLAKYPKLSASQSKVSELVRQSIESGNLETAILDAVGRLEVIAEQHCIDHDLELPPREKGWLHNLIELATSHALELSSRRNRLMHQAITTRGKRAHMKPAKPSMDQLRAVLQIAEDMP